MSVCQRKTGAWLVKYKDAATGKWSQRQFKTKELAEAFDASASMASRKDEPLSLREAVGAYLQRRTMSGKRISAYLHMVNDGGPAGHLGDRYVHTLTRTDLESVRSAMRASGLKTTTINLYVGMLKSALKWCASEDLTAVDPWARYGALPGGRTAHLSGTAEDLRKLYPLLPPWMRWAVKTALALCLRPGVRELFSLEWTAFDWRARTATVWMPKVGDAKTVFLPAWYLEEAQVRFRADSETGQRFVCRGARGRRVVSPTAHVKSWRRACRLAGVSMPFYAIRHIAASEMLAAGADLAAVAAQLGHRNVSTTAQFYAHAVARAQRRAAEALPAPALVGDGEQAGEMAQ